MKRGLSLVLMAAAISMAAMLIPPIAFALLVVFMYSFFDTFNLRAQISMGTAPEDDYLVHFDPQDKRLARMMMDSHKLVGWCLIAIGALIAYEQIIMNTLGDILWRWGQKAPVWRAVYLVMDQLPEVVLCVVLILCGIWLVRGPRAKKAAPEAAPEETDFQEYQPEKKMPSLLDRFARKAEPGQFIILRVDEKGERIPFTIADYDRDKGTVTVIFQIVGKSTESLNELGEGDSLQDMVGPLGVASNFEGVKKVAVIGGGLGTAIAYPQAKKLHSMGVSVDMINGFRNKDLIIIEDLCKAACTNLYTMTDDGSNGNQGFVTAKLEELINSGEKYDLVVAIGPLVMMKAVCDLTRKYDIKTIVSMNPIMIDGTGMCGGCRITVGGETKFACVDGPDFDGHLVDFDSAIARSRMFKNQEAESRERAHKCRLEGMNNA